MKSLSDPKRTKVTFQVPKNIFYDIFFHTQTKLIVGSTGNIYESTKITNFFINKK